VLSDFSIILNLYSSHEINNSCRHASLGISSSKFKEIEIPGGKPRTVWVAILEAEVSQLKGQRQIAIVMNAPVFKEAEEIDYLITNVEGEIVTEQWLVETYSVRNWVEVFYP
jgi:hypothetical protein